VSQTRELIQTLKRALKAQGKTYTDVAEVLDLTEASVKRLFSQQAFSLARLDRVCQMLGMEISDLVQQMSEQQQQLQQLSIAQERELTQDVTLALVTVCTLNRWRLADMVGFFQLSESECLRHLITLDRLGLIELLPGNRILLRVAPNFSWRENGPIQAFFQAKISGEFFQSRFDHEDESLVVLNGMLSAQSNAEFQRKLKRLAREFDLLNNDDAALDLSARKGTTLVLAMRGWRYGLFRPLLRDDQEKS
jgi:DNA-binding Xre family transcriptional regulator